MRAFLCLTILLAQSGIAASGQTADSVYLNGRIYTVADSHPWAAAMVIRGGKFVYVGSEEQARRFITKSTRVVDLHGRMVIPGIVDSHLHILGGGIQAKYTCQLPAGPFGKDQEALITRLKECERSLDAGQWLVTGPFLTEQFPQGKPERKFLDLAFPDRAIYMRETTGHNGLANGRALQLAGVADNSADPPGGKYVRDTAGRMTGELVESASVRVRGQIPPLTREQNIAALRYAIQTLHSLGVTSVQEASTTRELLEGLHALEESGELTLDVATHLLSHKGNEEDNDSLIRDRERYRSAHVDVSNIKMFLDGTPTAPYFTEVGFDTQTHQAIPDHLLIQPTVLNEALKRFDAMGLRVKMHVAGAGSAHVALDAIEYARTANPGSRIRHELAHSDLIIPEDMDRMKRLNVTADMSPAQWQDIGQFLGNPPQRAWRFRTLARKGVLMTIGSDWPVIRSPNLFPGVQGMLEYGDESIDLPLAIRILTLNSAVSAGRERERGSIEAGKDANFAVLDRQLFDIPTSRIGKTVVLATVFEGRPVFERAAPGQGAPAFSTCNSGADNPPACSALRGDRAEGWAAQTRSEVMASRGMVATSQPLAAQAGLRMLLRGGNAVDAAVAAAATLSVVEPMNVGPGGDLFALIYVARDKRVYALNASGRAPARQTIEFMNSLGYHSGAEKTAGMPLRGILSATVPGTVWGWEEALGRFGTLTFKEVLQPAVEYAKEGFPVSERISHEWVLPPALPLKGCCTELDPDSVATWYINGHAPEAAQIFRNPELAHTFELLQRNGRDAFYKGEIARAIVAKSARLGGTMTLEDLAGYSGGWSDPVETVYGGMRVLELPPPSQGWAALEELNILAACVPKLTGRTIGQLGPLSSQFWHLQIEAKKVAYADLLKYNADPEFTSIPLKQLLSAENAQSKCANIDPQRAARLGPPPQDIGVGDTVVISTADRWGNMVSWVNSNFANFGSGVTIPGYGFTLHDRGALFSLDPSSPNAIAPHKQPFNTLAAAFVMSGNEPAMTLQLMGGDMQAQGHAQVLVNLLDFGANVQAAGDMARFHHDQSLNEVELETQLYEAVGAQLQALGHRVRKANRLWMGGYQAIAVTPHPGSKQSVRSFRAGSDFGKDGQAVGY